MCVCEGQKVGLQDSSPSTVWVLGSNSGQQAQEQVPLTAELSQCSPSNNWGELLYGIVILYICHSKQILGKEGEFD